MSHSRGPPLLLLPLDLVSWLQVLIRAGGTEGCRRDVGKKGRRKKNSLIHQWASCAAMLPSRLYRSSSNRCLKRILLSCFTRGGGGQLACIWHPSRGWQGADVTGSSSLRARANNANSNTFWPYETIWKSELVSPGLDELASILGCFTYLEESDTFDPTVIITPNILHCKT